MLVITGSEGPQPIDAAELAPTPDRIELSAFFLSNPQPDDIELRELVKIEITELVHRNRPRWQPRYFTENCDGFFHILKSVFSLIICKKILASE